MRHCGEPLCLPISLESKRCFPPLEMKVVDDAGNSMQLSPNVRRWYRRHWETEEATVEWHMSRSPTGYVRLQKILRAHIRRRMTWKIWMKIVSSKGDGRVGKVRMCVLLWQPATYTRSVLLRPGPFPLRREKRVWHDIVIVALTTSSRTSVSFCSQVLFCSGIVIGPVTVGQARFSWCMLWHCFGAMVCKESCSVTLQ